MTMKMGIPPSGGNKEGKDDPSSDPSSSSNNSTSSTSSSATAAAAAAAAGILKGSGTARPRPPALWTVGEVKLWLGRHCGELGVKYSELFHQHNVNGRALLKINDMALQRMGISNPAHREEVWREIIKLKLKSDVMELRDLESQITPLAKTTSSGSSTSTTITTTSPTTAK